MKSLALLGLVLTVVCLAVSPLLSAGVPTERVQIELDLKTAERDGLLVLLANVRVKNTGDAKLSVQDLRNRRAVTFFVTDSLGNVVQPEGIAKVSPGHRPDVLLKPGESRSQEFVDLQFLTGSALFGYELKRGGTYAVVAVYRPEPRRPGVSSVEKRVEIKNSQSGAAADADKPRR